MSDNCVFCGVNGLKTSLPQSNDKKSEKYECPMCGVYIVFRDQLDSLDKDDKWKMTCLLAEHRLHRKTPLDFRTTNIREFIGHFPDNPLELLDRAFLNIAALIKHPGDRIGRRDEPNRVWLVDFEKQAFRFCTLLFSSEENEQRYELVKLLEKMQLIDVGYTPNGRGTQRQESVKITPQGWKYLQELRRRPTGGGKQAFVAMWFDQSRNEFYDSMKKAIEETGYKSIRIDEKGHNNKICDEIIAEIRKSSLLIADVTGNRGGVYFEAGFALGLGIPVIYICDSKNLGDIHFDTRQYNHILYESQDDLYEKLKNRIDATVPLLK